MWPILALVPAMAIAQDRPPAEVMEVRPEGAPPPPEPWARDVAPQLQEQARALFREGNAFFERSKYAEALDRYRRAAARWDHPAAHFNMAVCLINLDQPVEAHAHLRRALQYGPAALGHYHAQAITYEKLLLGQLARLRIACEQAGVEVTLDGKRLAVCPSRSEHVLRPGEHQLVASRAGYVPLARSMMLMAGTEELEVLALAPLDSLRRVERRWKTWVPWSVVGGGVGVALLGLFSRELAAADADRYAREVGEMCPQGCFEGALPGSVRDLRTRARLENGVAIGLFATAGAAVATGIVMFFLNAPREVPPTVPSVHPAITGSQVGLSIEARF